MFPHLHRLESVLIHHLTDEDFVKYFTSGAPLLKRMILFASGEWDSACPFSGSWTLLEELSVRRWRGIKWREVHFGQLRVLDIGFCGSLEISLIFRLIQENQRLENLWLGDITFTSSTSLTQSNTPVVLSHLKDLTLTNLAFANNHSHHPTFLILRHIRFPSCTKFTLHTSIESESTVDLEDLRSLLPSPLDILAHPSPNDPQTSQTTRGYLTAAFSKHGLALTVEQEPGCEFKYEVKLDKTPRGITSRWLKSALEDRPGDSEAVTQLSVEIGPEHLQEEVEGKILQILATPCTSALGTNVMAFPRLLGVEFEGLEGQGEAVLEMIRNRFGTPGVEAHRPDSINIKSHSRYEEFLWDSVDEIRDVYRFKVIHFGAIDSWPSSSPRPGSPESGWPPSDDEGSSVADEGGWDLDPEGSSITGEDGWGSDSEAESHGVWEEE
ncbi:hypothetical protein FRC05_002210 [Tulasnella sp. 425]|nr:hypothetical protein FRC05_002210 [Tulasnella sp. 425]